MPLAFLTSSHHTTRPLTDPDRESIKSLSYQTALHSPQQSGVIIASIRNLSHRHRSERAHAGCKCQKLPTDVPCDCRRLSGTVLNFRIHIPHLASSECMADGSVSCQNVGHHRAGARAHSHRSMWSIESHKAHVHGVASSCNHVRRIADGW